MKRSIITSIGDPRTWNGENGAVYYYAITFQNGDTGEVGKKVASSIELPFDEGQEVPYEITPNTKSDSYPAKIKIFIKGDGTEFIPDDNQGGQFNQTTTQTSAPQSNKSSNSIQNSIIAQSSLKAAVDWISINGVDDKPDGMTKIQYLKDVSDWMFDYVKGKENG